MCLHLGMWVEEETWARSRAPFQLVWMLLPIWNLPEAPYWASWVISKTEPDTGLSQHAADLGRGLVSFRGN